MKCTEKCKLYPCFMANKGKECGFETDSNLDNKLKEIVELFYGDSEDFRKAILQLVVKVYVNAWTEDETEEQLKILREITHVFKVLFNKQESDERDDWEELFTKLTSGKND